MAWKKCEGRWDCHKPLVYEQRANYAQSAVVANMRKKSGMTPIIPTGEARFYAVLILFLNPNGLNYLCKQVSLLRYRAILMG